MRDAPPGGGSRTPSSPAAPSTHPAKIFQFRRVFYPEERDARFQLSKPRAPSPHAGAPTGRATDPCAIVVCRCSIARSAARLVCLCAESSASRRSPS